MLFNFEESVFYQALDMDQRDITYYVHWFWHRKEAFIWIAALLWLAIDNPAAHHYTHCPFHNAGISFCPGCGLGRSIGYFFRLDLPASFMAHPLGIPAIGLLVFRAIRVFQKASKYSLVTH